MERLPDVKIEKQICSILDKKLDANKKVISDKKAEADKKVVTDKKKEADKKVKEIKEILYEYVEENDLESKLYEIWIVFNSYETEHKSSLTQLKLISNILNPIK
jgi:hypothetical protein